MGFAFYVLPFRSSVDTSEEAVSVIVVGKAVEITDSIFACQFSGWKFVFVLARPFLSASCRTVHINYREMFGYSALVI